MLAQRVRRRTHCALRAPFKQLRQVSARSACVLRHTHAPPALRFSARTEGNWGPDIHTGLCFARPVQGAQLQSPRAAQVVPSAAMARVAVAVAVGCWLLAVGCPAFHPIWQRLRRGGFGVAGVPKDTPASSTDSPWLSERRAQRKASSTAHPATATAQVCPVATRRGR